MGKQISSNSIENKNFLQTIHLHVDVFQFICGSKWNLARLEMLCTNNLFTNHKAKIWYWVSLVKEKIYLYYDGFTPLLEIDKDWEEGGVRGVMVIVEGIGHGDTSSNPGLIAFHIALIPLGKVWVQLFSLQLWVNSRQTRFFSLGKATSLGEGKLWIQTC